MIILCFFLCFQTKFSQWLSEYKEHNEWNQKKDTPPKDIKLSDVPKLDQLLSREDMIADLKNSPYFLGFNKDGQYAALLIYDMEEQAYQVQVYDSYSNDLRYAFQIPELDPIKSNEIILAQEALDLGYEIKIPPKVLNWDRDMKLEVEDEMWGIERNLEGSMKELMIRKKGSNETWVQTVGEGKWTEQETFVTKIYAHPYDSKILTFVQKNPVFIHLNRLTGTNSLVGKKNEVDKWLYGEFQIIYDQNLVSEQKGYLAVSGSGNLLSGGKWQRIDQWVYLETDGRMKWYGNPEGIFNSEGKPLYQSKNPFLFTIQSVKEGSSNELKYFLIDILDKKTGKLIKTMLLEWDHKERKMNLV